MVIGAGCVGAAVAYALRNSGREVFVLERAPRPCMGMSSRNSGVVHAGIYYPKESLKTRLCRRGNRLLHEFAPKHGVPFEKVGKYIVAHDAAACATLEQLYQHNLGAVPLEWRTAEQVPNGVHCRKALFSPTTAIIDQDSLVNKLLEESGAELLLHQEVTSVTAEENGVILTINGETCRASWVFNCGGLDSDQLCNHTTHFYARGVYFQIKPPPGIQLPHLVYPAVPKERETLGIHLTCNLAGEWYLGPDIEWIDTPSYGVDPNRADAFYRAAVTYLPWLERNMLQPGYAGVRAKRSRHHFSDFLFHREGRLVHCLGIESPGLTAAMAIGEMLAADCIA
ncbi:FAD-dependent oxidoreductase [Acanthopleuribacter pedis]